MSNNFFPPPQYPLHSFLTVARDAAYETQRNVQAPSAMIGMSLIGAITATCQCAIEVKLPFGLARPVTLNTLYVGSSGDRKSGLDRIVFGPLRDADAIAFTHYKTAIDTYKTELDWWKTVFNSIRREIERSLRRGDATEEVKEKLAVHSKLKPKKPKLRTLLRSDITQRALMDALEGDGESIVIMTDDGEALFKSGAMSNLGVLNQLFDSPAVLSLDRADDEHVVVMNPCVSIFIMTQEEVLSAYRENRGKLAKGSGHWARYLVGFPQTTKGSRWAVLDEAAWEHLPKFHERIRELLAKHQRKLASGKIEREILEFSADAKARWIQATNHVESMIRPGGYMSDIDDFASKSMEIIARLAASMHYFAGEDGRISLDTLERAIEIVTWHLGEYKRLFSPQSVPPQDQVDAQAIATYLRTRIWHGPNSNSWVLKNHILRNGPVRNRSRLDAALTFLTMQGGLQVARSADLKDRRTYIWLLDHFFANVSM